MRAIEVPESVRRAAMEEVVARASERGRAAHLARGERARLRALGVGARARNEVVREVMGPARGSWRCGTRSARSRSARAVREWVEIGVGHIERNAVWFGASRARPEWLVRASAFADALEAFGSEGSVA